MTLAFGLYNPEDEETLKENLVRTVLRTDCHIDGGILTVKHIFGVLSDMGRHDLAMKMALKEDLPSFGYMILKGATTLWESWEGNDSQNHQMFGSISEWFYKHILGIRTLEAGFKTFEICPKFDMLTFAEGEHNTPYGNIVVRWDKTAETVLYKITVPAGTSAVVTPPKGYSCEKQSLSQGDYEIVFVSND